MALVITKCPTTGAEVATGMEADNAEQLRMLVGGGGVRNKCTSCNKPHVLTMRNTILR
ncbi:MAG: hypothetical protein QOD72_655 [Acidimicrobiaceae bacterium]|jgi:hypothetical protein|nr:hypothetical protein [Acidimicrobiaceae bacterium]